jgi:hypothetical protein
MRRTRIASSFVSPLFSVLVAAVVLLGASRTASATEVGYNRKFGLGFMVGDPTGITAKLWVAPTNSIDFGLGFWGYGFDDHCDRANNCGRFGDSSGTFNADYLWQSNLIRGQAQLDWHIGAGGRVIWFGGCNDGCFDLKARMPIGLDLMFANPAMLEIFFELAPSLYVVPFVGFDIEGALGARFYF